jgi:hypothetical protein
LAISISSVAGNRTLLSRTLNYNSTIPERNSNARCPRSSKHREIPGYAAPPLIFRAGITSVFSGLVGFLAVLCLGVGIYLLQEAVVDPLRAQSIALIAGAFALAVASMLIYFIFSSLAKSRNGKSRYRATLPE